VSPGWILEVEKLFETLDEEKRGAIDGDRIQYFLMALLMNEINANNKNDMVLLV